MTEEQRQRAIRVRLSRAEQRDREWILTGFAPLDKALDGGLPRSAIVEIFGGSSNGKTTLALQIVAYAQRNGVTAAWIDAEHAFDPAYAVGLGVHLPGMPLAQPQSAEEALEIAAELGRSGAVDLLVIDSAAALVPRLELNSAIGESGEGLHGRVLASGLRRLSRIVEASRMAAVFLNQTRSRSGEEESSAGGPPLKLFAALRIALDAQSGDSVGFRILKHRAAAPFRKGYLRRARTGEFVQTP